MGSFEWPWNERMRCVLQSEAAECGLAALTMIARFHGHRVDLAGLRRRFPSSIKGMTLRDLMGVASDLDLAARAVRTPCGVDQSILEGFANRTGQ